jgi:NhaA family Na+:H+ antiporter
MLTGPGAATVAVGVFVGLVVGKLVGILGGAWIGTRLRVAVLPSDLHWRHLAGAAALGGIGFTVSLFVSGLAFDDAALADAAKVAILGASVVSAAAGAAVLSLGRR